MGKAKNTYKISLTLIQNTKGKDDPEHTLPLYDHIIWLGWEKRSASELFERLVTYTRNYGED